MQPIAADYELGICVECGAAEHWGAEGHFPDCPFRWARDISVEGKDTMGGEFAIDCPVCHKPTWIYTLEGDYDEVGWHQAGILARQECACRVTDDQRDDLAVASYEVAQDLDWPEVEVPAYPY